MLRPAEGAVTLQHVHVVVSELGQPCARPGGQRFAPLDREHILGEPAQDRRGVPGASPDLENAFVAFQAERFDCDRHDVGLRDRLLLADGQRGVSIGELHELVGHEGLTRNGAERIEEARVRNAAARKLEVDHLRTRFRKGHGDQTEQDLDQRRRRRFGSAILRAGPSRSCYLDANFAHRVRCYGGGCDAWNKSC